LAKEAKRIYRALEIQKREIDPGQAWQSYYSGPQNLDRAVS